MNESKVFGVSVRGWLAATAVITLCATVLLQIDVKEPFYTVVISIVSFYFGQKNSAQQGGVNEQPGGKT